MRYAPYQQEYQDVSAMSDNQLLEYFLTRVFETEEVWGLDDGAEWIIQERDGEKLMPVWPYQKFAREAAIGEWQDLNPQAESLEDFLHTTLEMLVGEDAMVEIMPRAESPKCLISPHRLKSILEGMISAGEYTLDG